MEDMFMEKAFGSFFSLDACKRQKGDFFPRVVVVLQTDLKKRRNSNGKFHGNILSSSLDATTSRLFFSVMNMNVTGN